MDRSIPKLSDFLLDESFQRFVLLNSAIDKIYWDTWLKKNPENSSVLNEAKEILCFIYNNKVKSNNSDLENEVFNSILQRIDNEKHSADFKMSTVRILKIAAFLIVLTGIGWLLKSGITVLKQNNQYVEILVRKGELETIILPDSSKVWLNSGTYFKYPVNFNSKSREVFISGEAFFNVRHNSQVPFIVKANNSFIVKVLGTEFNLKCYPGPGTFETTLFKGLVELSIPGKEGNAIKKLTLYPKEKAVFRKENKPGKIEKIKLSDNELSIIKCWKENSLTFKNETFEQIARLLENFYGIKIFITAPDLMHERFTGSFSKEENIYQVMDVFKRTESIDYNYRNGNLTVFKKTTSNLK